MSRRQNGPLHELTKEEREWLEQVSRAQSEPAVHVIRSKILLEVADGKSYTDAAKAVGRKSCDAVSELVARFNKEGLAALESKYGGGARVKYGTKERERILAEARRKPNVEQDGTATWSLSLLRRSLRKAEDGLPDVSTYTVWLVLHEEGWGWQKDVSWCDTGKVKRKRKEGVVEVTDPAATQKKT